MKDVSKMSTIKMLVEAVLAAQTEPNIDVVVASFHATLSDLKDILEGQEALSTDMLNQHHISVLYTARITFLSGITLEGERLNRALEYAFAIHNSPEPVIPPRERCDICNWPIGPDEENTVISHAECNSPTIPAPRMAEEETLGPLTAKDADHIARRIYGRGPSKH